MSTRKKNPPCKELQPLGWSIESGWDYSKIGEIYGLKIPSEWIALIKGLPNSKGTPPIVSLHTAIRAALRNICILPKSFLADTTKRSPYWLVYIRTNKEAYSVDFLSNLIQFLYQIVSEWLLANYGNNASRVRETLSLMSPHLKEMKFVLIEPTEPLISKILPKVIVNWLLLEGYEFKITDGEGNSYSHPMVAVETIDEKGCLVSWPPTPFKKDFFSYTLLFWVTVLDNRPLLLFKPGIRRYIARPLIKRQEGDKPLPHGTTKIMLPKNRGSTVWVAIEDLGLLNNVDKKKTTLVNFVLHRYEDTVIWEASLPEIFKRIAPQIDMPTAMEFITNPAEFTPQYLFTYNTQLGSHPVGAGVEAADRFEMFERLNSYLSAHFSPLPLVKKCESLTNKKRSSPKKLASSSEINSKNKSVYNIYIQGTLDYSSILKEVLISSGGQIVQEIVEVNPPNVPNSELNEDKPMEKLDHKVLYGQLPSPMYSNFVPENTELKNAPLVLEYINTLGDKYQLNIYHNYFNQELFAPLAVESCREIKAGNQARIKFIKQEITTNLFSYPGKGEENNYRGILVELPDYREFGYTRRIKDPKSAIRIGHSQCGIVSQFITPVSELADKEEEMDGLLPKRKNAILDLLRQLDFPLGIPYHKAISNSLIPKKLSVVAFKVITVNSTSYDTKKKEIPLVIKIDSNNNILCLIPSDEGEKWLTYYDTHITLSRMSLSDLEYSPKKIEAFFMHQLKTYRDGDTLVILDEYSLKNKVSPWLLGDEINSLIDPEMTEKVRIVLLRYSTDGVIPALNPIAVFNRYSGIYSNQDVFKGYFSIGQDPQTAKKPTEARQKDRIAKPSWNQCALLITWLKLQPYDNPEEWSLVVHNLRRCSPFLNSDIVTRAVMPLHAVESLKKYLPSFDTPDLPEIELEEEEINSEPEYIQLSLF